MRERSCCWAGGWVRGSVRPEATGGARASEGSPPAHTAPRTHHSRRLTLFRYHPLDPNCSKRDAFCIDYTRHEPEPVPLPA